jgi:hypothetical protein
MGCIVGVRETVKAYTDHRHLTGVGFEVKEAAARYGRGLKKK